MELTEKEKSIILTLRKMPSLYQDGFLLIHLSPVNETHIVRHAEGHAANLGLLSKKFYTAFLELKRWLKLPQATFLIHFEDDMCRVFNFYHPSSTD